MRCKLFSVAVVFAALVLGFVIFSCDPDDSGSESVTVTFDINYEGGADPDKVSLFKGNAVGSRWPTDPAPYSKTILFEGWYDGAGKKYTGDTKINGSVTLKAKWTEMPTTSPSLTADALEDLFKTTNNFPETLSDARKIWGMKSPAITFATTADPVPMVYCPKMNNSGATEAHGDGCDECTLYIYGSNDTLFFTATGGIDADNFDKTIQGLRMISTKDLVNWTEHGVLNVVGKSSTHPLWPYTPADRQISFANNTWAPTAEWFMVNNKPKFFLYFCNGGADTTVLISDVSPIGPYYNPGLTSCMINKEMPIGEGVNALFDPGTMIDYDGKAYMFLGGLSRTSARRTELSTDPDPTKFMITSITTDEEIYRINLPWHFEATDIWKWKGIYYVNYTSDWGGGKPGGYGNIDVLYMMNKEGPLAPFETDQTKWGGPKRLLPNGSYGDNTNHASLFDFRGKPYLVYHNQSAAQAYNGGRLRGAHIDPITIADDGTITQFSMGVKGPDQIGALNPFNLQEAETLAITAGVYTKYDETASNKAVIASIDTGDWLGLYGVDFGSGAQKFNAKIKISSTGLLGSEGNVDEPEYWDNRPSTKILSENDFFVIEIRTNPEQQGIANPANNTTLGTGSGRQTRITGGEVIGRVQVKVPAGGLDKWTIASADLLKTVTGKQDIVFVFYSSQGAALEKHNASVKPETDARRRDVGFAIDQWWFE